MFPNGLALQILCQLWDLCTKRQGPPIWPHGSCYKSSSDVKLLILKGLPDCRFSGHLSQALDFPGLAGQRRQTINKVIHTIRSTAAKLMQINDLNGVSETDLNIRA
jgi:hypothetical protein